MRKEMTSESLKAYEVAQYRKAFYDGSDKAWKQYRANVKRMATRFEKETGMKVNLNLLMS